MSLTRNSTTIFITTGEGRHECTTPLAWLDNAPDFRSFEEPTLSVLRKAWEEGKNDIEIVPDPQEN